MRYLPHTAKDIQKMLETIGVSSIDALFSSIPENLQFKKTLQLPTPLSEIELRHHLRELSRKNAHGEDWGLFLGAGSYSHYIPSAISQLLTRGEFLTAYTPYQPEVSQGTLQAIFEYQTLVCELFGMEVSNASHYDGSTATAEAALMALGITKRKKILVSKTVHPEYRQTLRTYIQDPEIILEEIAYTSEGDIDRADLKKKLDSSVGCVLVGYPNFFGIVEDLSDIASLAHDQGALLVTSTSESLSLGIFQTPGDMGADIAVGEGQSFGNTMSFGGPGLGFFATKKQYVRAIPGRLVGETVDAEGKRGFVLTLATREQHIRREKASSNICTNVALCALAATMTMTFLGKQGLIDLAQMNYDRATNLKEEIQKIKGVRVVFSKTTFNEFVIQTESPTETVFQNFLKEKIIPGVQLNRWYPELGSAFSVCVTEMNSEEQIRRFLEALKKYAHS